MNKQLYIKDSSRDNLSRLGFKEAKSGMFTLRFPVYKYRKMVVLDGQLSVFEGDHDIRTDVFCEDGTRYAAYYNNEFAINNMVVPICEQRIENMAHKLGIKEKKDEDKKTKRFGKDSNKSRPRQRRTRPVRSDKLRHKDSTTYNS